MKNAKRCINCGLRFNLEHEPVPDEGNGIPTTLRREKRRKTIIFAIVAVIVILALFVFYFINQRAIWRIGGLI